jgi:hypothetical protein
VHAYGGQAKSSQPIGIPPIPPSRVSTCQKAWRGEAWKTGTQWRKRTSGIEKTGCWGRGDQRKWPEKAQLCLEVSFFVPVGDRSGSNERPTGALSSTMRRVESERGRGHVNRQPRLCGAWAGLG